jgi:hypothetical protein
MTEENTTEDAQAEEEVSPEKFTKVYLKIREKRAELKAQFEQEDSKLEAQLNAIKSALLDYCKKQGVDSVRTQAGLFYRGIKTRYWTNDWDSMNRFILEHGVPEFYEKRLNQTSVKQFLEENPDVLPPGLNVDSEYVITVRKK